MCIVWAHKQQWLPCIINHDSCILLPKRSFLCTSTRLELSTPGHWEVSTPLLKAAHSPQDLAGHIEENSRPADVQIDQNLNHMILNPKGHLTCFACPPPPPPPPLFSSSSSFFLLAKDVVGFDPFAVHEIGSGHGLHKICAACLLTTCSLHGCKAYVKLSPQSIVQRAILQSLGQCSVSSL